MEKERMGGFCNPRTQRSRRKFNPLDPAVPLFQWIGGAFTVSASLAIDSGTSTRNRTKPCAVLKGSVTK
jgi:hypothetical protein